ncbi:MAG: MFS transporter [Armatimonadota bacterium]|nr:MFS transporter [Armatimonadota bacterium]MDW8155670.1 MFS transporter [Armatimonadota bacterium]
MTGPLYALGAFGASLLVQTLNLWLFPFYAGPPPRLPPEQVGLALAVGRLSNSLSDLLVARWSDAVSTPWGRRRPFLLGGSPILAASFLLVWVPPPHGADLYLATVLAAFFGLFAAVVNPYLALLGDLPSTSSARVAAAAWQAAGNLAGTAVAYGLSGPLHLRFGYPAMAAAFAVVATVCLWACAASVREPLGDAPRVPLSAALRLLACSRPLQAYLAGLGLSWVGLGMVSLVLVFAVTVLMGLPTARVPSVLLVALGSTAACLPLVAAWGRRSGAQAALEACLWLAAVFLPAVSLVGRLPGAPHVLGYGLVVLAGLPLAALYVLPNAILAQLAARYGLPATHFGVQGLVLNLSNAAAATAVGFLLRLGYAPGHDLGLRLVPACAAALVVAGLWAFRRLRHS